MLKLLIPMILITGWAWADTEVTQEEPIPDGFSQPLTLELSRPLVFSNLKPYGSNFKIMRDGKIDPTAFYWQLVYEKSEKYPLICVVEVYPGINGGNSVTFPDKFDFINKPYVIQWKQRGNLIWHSHSSDISISQNDIHGPQPRTIRVIKSLGGTIDQIGRLDFHIVLAVTPKDIGQCLGQTVKVFKK